MTVMEVIHLRMAWNHPETLAEAIREAVKKAPSAPDVRVYRHTRIEGDLLIHIHHPGSEQRDQPSDLGVRLAALLRAHGLVDHSLWVGNDRPDATQ